MKVDTTWLKDGQQLEVKGGGRLVVGQEMDSIEGDFDVDQSLDGVVADYRFYDVALDAEEMSDLVNCRSTRNEREPLLDLRNGKLMVEGPTRTLNVTEREVCEQRDVRFDLLFPQRMNFENAVKWCTNLKSTLSVAKSNKDNIYMYDNYVKFSPQCTGTWTNLYWIGVYGDLPGDRWLTPIDPQPITYDNFIQGWGKPSKKFQCVTMITKEDYKWAAASCLTETCVVCNFTRFPPVRLRGLCKESLLERSFHIFEYENNQLVFDGRWHVRIVWTNASWLMESRVHPDLKAWIINEERDVHPVGIHTWQVQGDECEEKQVRSYAKLQVGTFSESNNYRRDKIFSQCA